MEKLNELKFNFIDQLRDVGASIDVINAVKNARNETELRNIIAAWQRSEEYQRNVEKFAKDDHPREVTVPQAYVQPKDRSAELRATFAGQPRETIRPQVALYNNSHQDAPTSERELDSILSQPQGYDKNKVADFYKQIDENRRVADSLQGIRDYENSFVGKTIKPVAQAADLASGFVPGAPGAIAAGVGPLMRAYDRYRRGEKFDQGAFTQDLMYNEVGQSVGGRVLGAAANLMHRVPIPENVFPRINKFVNEKAFPTMARASQARREDKAAYRNIVSGLMRELDQLVAKKRVADMYQQIPINQRISSLADILERLGLKETAGAAKMAREEAGRVYNPSVNKEVIPFTRGEQVLSGVDDAITKYGVKSSEDFVNRIVGDDELNEDPLQKYRAEERKGLDSLMAYFLKLDSLRGLGYNNPDYDEAVKRLGLENVPPEMRGKMVADTLRTDSINTANVR